LTIIVDIDDRLYDYTDEERAAEAVANFQELSGLDDSQIVELWSDELDARRVELEKLIFNAVDANGSDKRARESVPGGVHLSVS
jgi:hypothetical protein